MFTKLKKLLNWQKTPKPQYSLAGQIYSELKPFRLPIILVISIFLIGTLGYIAIDDVDVFTAFYQTGITFTTVGYGEMYDMSDDGRLFSIFLIVAGFAVFTLAIGVLVEVIQKGKLIPLLKERQMLYKIARLKHHFVICYHTQFTIELTSELRKSQIPFVVISPQDDLESIAKQYNYPFYIQAEPHTDVAMQKSHISSAKGVITLSNSIADNIAIISSVRLFEKELGRNPYYIMSIANKSVDVEKLIKLGADEVINPNRLMAQRAAAIVRDHKIKNLLEEFLYTRDRNINLEEFKIPKQSWILFKKLRESHLRELTNCSVIGIKHKSGKFIPMPRGDVIIHPDDVLFVMGTKDGLIKMRKLLRSSKKPKETQYV
ncbi:MAG: potassium channel protein [Epsilonproteobacteria bacterium]|nr:potassium channel protein [Campylobacterota bacterium]